MQHFNIGKKVEVNPFEGVKYVLLSSCGCGGQVSKLKGFLNSKACKVDTRKIKGSFEILFDVELLDFTTLLTWYAPYRGKFYLGKDSIHFTIEEDIMTCW